MVVVTARDCQACRGTAQEERDQWLPTFQACPSDQTGTHTWERQQVRSRDVFTHCPLGTSTLPHLRRLVGVDGYWGTTQ